MTLAILNNIQVFLNRATATGPECSAWHEASQYVSAEIQRLQNAHLSDRIEEGVKATLSALPQGGQQHGEA